LAGYISGGFAISVRTGFDTMLAIAKTTAIAVVIIFEEAFRFIGRNILPWMWEGIKSAGISINDFAIRLAAEIGEAFINALGDVLGKERIDNLFRMGETGAVVIPPAEAFGPQVRARLTGLYTDLNRQLEALQTNASGLTPEMRKLIEDAKALGETFKKAGQQIWDALTIGETKLPEIEAAGKKAINALKDEPHKWQKSWDTAAASIDGAFEDAFVSITKNVKNAAEVIENLVDSIAESITRMIYQQYIANKLVGIIGNAFGMPATTSSQQTPPDASRVSDAGGGATGGLVYAKRGIFTPKGTDTVPAMLTPGEAVVPKGVTDWFRKMFGGGGSSQPSQPMTVNVNAIDAAGTYQFLNKNKRALASMMGNTRDQNHPSRRNGQ